MTGEQKPRLKQKTKKPWLNDRRTKIKGRRSQALNPKKPRLKQKTQKPWLNANNLVFTLDFESNLRKNLPIIMKGRFFFMSLYAEKFTFRGCEYYAKWVKCGKKQCTKCPHGPYWYVIIPVPSSKPVIRYIGKQLKGAVADYYANKFGGSPE